MHATDTHTLLWVPHHTLRLWAMQNGEMHAEVRMTCAYRHPSHPLQECFLNQALKIGQKFELVLKESRGDAKKQLTPRKESVTAANAEQKNVEEKVSLQRQVMSDAEEPRQVRTLFCAGNSSCAASRRGGPSGEEDMDGKSSTRFLNSSLAVNLENWVAVSS